MTKWDEMIQAAFVNGTKLPNEVRATNLNCKKLEEALDASRKSADNLNTFKNTLIAVINEYTRAKEIMDIDTLRKLNNEGKIRNSEIDKSFEVTLNWLSASIEGETEEEAEKRIIKAFKLPIIK